MDPLRELVPSAGWSACVDLREGDVDTALCAFASHASSSDVTDVAPNITSTPNAEAGFYLCRVETEKEYRAHGSGP